MNGPEHYREAERLMQLVAKQVGQITYYEGDDPDTAVALAAAQVHATLALAAATASPVGYQPGAIRKAWTEATA